MARSGYRMFVGVCLLAGIILWGIQVPDAFAKVDIEETDGVTTYSVALDDVTFKTVTIDGKTFDQATLRGADGYEGVVYSVGEPEIPVIRILADGVTAVEVKSDSSTSKRLFGYSSLPIVPNQASAEKKPGAIRTFVMNENTYSKDSFIGDSLYKTEVIGTVRGVARTLITLYPLAYNPVSGDKKLRTNFEIVIKHQDLALTPQIAKQEAMALVIGAQFTNSPSLKKYKAFKEGRGLKMIDVPVGKEGTIEATPAAIRKKLQELYKNTTYTLKYALIIGDHEDVPGASPTAISGVIDHYYASIDTNNYESDIGTPDISVGRVSVANESQLAAVLEKFTKYQTGQFNSRTWLNEIAFIATDDQYEIAEGSHNYVIDTYSKGRGFVGHFPKEPQPGGDQLYAITHKVSDEKVVQSMRAGRVIINYSGHGSTDSWAGPNVSQSNVRSLNHDSALPFVISNACITGDFTVQESFAETWLRHPKGAIMFWGSMDSSYWDEDDILERRMFDGIFRDKIMKFGSITQFALTELWKHYGGSGKSKYYFETYITFGDPSIELRFN